MRLAALVPILLVLATPASALSPENAYWAVRQRAIERLEYKGHAKPSDRAYNDFETAALADLERRIIAFVGPLKIEGFANKPKSSVVALSTSPEYGVLDAVNFRANNKWGGGLGVTTKTLLQFWLQEEAKESHAKWADASIRALKADEFYGAALNPENGFVGVADFALETPAGASFATAKLGRVKDPATDTLPRPFLIVTVVKGRFVLIASMQPATKVPQIPVCAAKAASLEEGVSLPDAWGPSGDPALGAWRNCERRNLPAEPYFAQLKRQAQEISERLARAN